MALASTSTSILFGVTPQTVAHLPLVYKATRKLKPCLHPHPLLLHSQHQMTDMEQQQADHLPEDLLPRFIAPQQHNPVLYNAAVSLARRNNLPRVNAHISVQNVVQMPPAANANHVQLEGQWDDVVPPAIRVHGAVQDTPQDRQLFNVANHRFADYPELRDVSDLYIPGLSTFACDQQPCHQNPAVPYPYPNIGPAQGAPEHEQVIPPVCIDLPLMHRLPTGFLVGPPRIQSFGVCPSGYCTRPYPDRLS